MLPNDKPTSKPPVTGADESKTTNAFVEETTPKEQHNSKKNNNSTRKSQQKISIAPDLKPGRYTNAQLEAMHVARQKAESQLRPSSWPKQSA